MIRYNARALRAFTWFFRPYNNIDVFVEDSAARNVYEVLINRILDGKAKVTRVIQLGGRLEVLKKCAEHDASDARPYLYIVDGDLDLLIGQAPRQNGLYSLKVYALENLLLCASACTELGFETLANTPREEIEKRLGTKSLIANTAQSLLPLFCCYASVHAVAPDVATVGLGLQPLLTQTADGPMLSEDKIQARIDTLESTIFARGLINEYRAVLETISPKLGASQQHIPNFISAKDYIVFFVEYQLRTKARYRGSKAELLMRLAKHARLDIDPDLADAVRAASARFLL